MPEFTPILIFIGFIVLRVFFEAIGRRAQQNQKQPPAKKELLTEELDAPVQTVEESVPELAVPPGKRQEESRWTFKEESIWEQDWKRELKEKEEEAKRQIKKLHEEASLKPQAPLERIAKKKRVLQPKFFPQNIIQGVLFSEILGPPGGRRGTRQKHRLRYP